MHVMKRRRSGWEQEESIGAIREEGDDDDDSDGQQRRENDYAQAAQRQLLSKYNAIVEGGGGEHEECLPDSIWMEWLWQTDPLQECHMDLMMNRMHLLGLLIARYRASRQPHVGSSSATLQQILSPGAARRMQLWLFDCPVSRYSLRQLSDSLQNILMQWNGTRAFATVPKIREAVDALFHRFGVLASGTGDSRSACSPYDDPGSIEKFLGDEGRVVLSRICLRRMVNSFLVLYRHMHCWEAREEVEGDGAGDADCGIKLHHILAASDDFSRLSMHWDLMPGAKLTYVHDFRGLFNCVSQVRPRFCFRSK